MSILAPPTNQVVFEGQAASFNVLASGVQPLGYTWFFGNSAISNATSDQLLLANVSLADGANNYRVVVTNAYLAITSAPVSLTVVRQATLSLSIEGTNVHILSRGTPNRQHRLLQSSTLGFEWVVAATNTPAASGTSTWIFPIIKSENQFFRVVMP